MAVCMKHSFLSGLLTILAAFSVCLATTSYAQETVTGSSSQRSRADSRVNSELTDTLNALNYIRDQVKAMSDHVKKSMPACGANGKLSWNPSSNTWTCPAETDPNTKQFARIALPSCAAGQVLSYQNATTLKCVTPAVGGQGDVPNHQWSTTSLRFEKPNGTWGSYVNLKGPPGDDVVCP